MTQAGDVFQPTTSAHLQLAPGVDGSRGLTLPQGNLSQFGISRWHLPSLLQEQAVQMEPLLPPLITPACLGQVRASLPLLQTMVPSAFLQARCQDPSSLCCYKLSLYHVRHWMKVPDSNQSIIPFSAPCFTSRHLGHRQPCSLFPSPWFCCSQPAHPHQLRSITES